MKSIRIAMPMGFPGFGDDDAQTIELAKRLRPQIEQIGELAIMAEPQFRKIQEDGNFLQPYISERVYVSRGSIGFFPAISNKISSTIQDPASVYLRIAQEYKMFVQGRLAGLDEINTAKDFPEGIELDPQNPNETLRKIQSVMQGDYHTVDPTTRRAAKAGMNMLNTVLSNYVGSKVNFLNLVGGLKSSIGKYEKYLETRFVKADIQEEKANRNLMQLMINPDDEGPKTTYVKVKLVNANPVLTDVLLQMIDAVPEFREASGKGIGSERKVKRTLSSYSVTEATEMLSAISDPAFLNYIENSREFFQKAGETLSAFNNASRFMERGALDVVGSGFMDILGQGIENDELRKALKTDHVKVEKQIERVTKLNLDKIVQEEDDVAPENRMERDVFKARDKLFTFLYDSMKELSSDNDEFSRETAARDIIIKAAELKYTLKTLSMDWKKRKLRKDKLSDNEYYVARKAEIGEVVYERKPSPNVKMDSVIGVSFDEAKKHLTEIIETGDYEAIMRMTAPGGKVKSNILLIGPYGCGKTELGRAVCSDERVIGVSISAANTLTAYMHESVSNVKRLYDKAMELREKSRNTKPVVLVLDEFNTWFAKGGESSHGNTDMSQIENTFLEVLDGMEDYTGIITFAMTNKPNEIPAGIMRRFRYVDIVGQLNVGERKKILKMFVEERLPVTPEMSTHYDAWAAKLEDAPGDVIRKVVDEVHLQIVPDFIRANKRVSNRIKTVLNQREVAHGKLGSRDIEYVKDQLKKANCYVQPDQVSTALDMILKKPNIRQQITAAKSLYKDARHILEDISNNAPTFGLRHRDRMFGQDQ